jgi:hypothetical protein
MPSSSVGQLFALIVESVPKFLLTDWEYLYLRPRRFFLRWEQDPERYVEPWPFLLLNAGIAGAVTLLVTSAQRKSSQWEWSQFGFWVFMALLAHIAAVVCGAIAGRLVRRPVTSRAMFSAFAYAGVWLPVYIPLVAACTGEINIQGNNRLLLMLLAVEICQMAYLIVSFARFNYIEGWRMLWFIAVTCVLVLGSAIAVEILMRPQFEESEWRRPQLAIEHRFSSWCDHVYLQGEVQTEPNGASVWFEWGNTPNLGHVTTSQRVRGDLQIRHHLEGLTENTTYYYRLVMSSKNGVKHGWLQSFTTAACRK